MVLFTAEVKNPASAFRGQRSVDSGRAKTFGLGCPKLIQKRKTRDVAKPEMAPVVLAAGSIMPRLKRPSRGPPTMPKTEREALKRFQEVVSPVWGISQFASALCVTKNHSNNKNLYLQLP